MTRYGRGIISMTDEKYSYNPSIVWGFMKIGIKIKGMFSGSRPLRVAKATAERPLLLPNRQQPGSAQGL
jgi:hypothetical protein